MLVNNTVFFSQNVFFPMGVDMGAAGVAFAPILSVGTACSTN